MVQTKELEFIPPKKRKEPKKDLTKKNNVDHVKVQGKLTNSGTEEDKENLNNVVAANKRWNSAELIDVIPLTQKINGADSEENELNLYENISQKPLRSSTVTPSSFSESSFDEARSNKSHEILTGRGSTKKRVNIRTDLDNDGKEKTSPVGLEYEDLESGETSILNADQHSLDRFNSRKMSDSYLTMTGTIKRGKKLGQEFNVQLNISRDELEKISAAAMAKDEQVKRGCRLSCSTGPHVLLWTLVCFPFVFLITCCYSFYMGTITWYNIFNYFNEEKTYLHKLFMSPLLIVTYPVVILLCTFGLGFYGACKQLTCSIMAWNNEVYDLEKGFYNWVCSVLNLTICSPYEVVILTDIRDSNEEPMVVSQSEESL